MDTWESMFATGGPFIASFLVFVTGMLAIGKWIVVPVIKAAAGISENIRETAISMTASGRIARESARLNMESTKRLDHLVERLSNDRDRDFRRETPAE